MTFKALLASIVVDGMCIDVVQDAIKGAEDDSYGVHRIYQGEPVAVVRGESGSVAELRELVRIVNCRNSGAFARACTKAPTDVSKFCGALLGLSPILSTNHLDTVSRTFEFNECPTLPSITNDRLQFDVDTYPCSNAETLARVDRYYVDVNTGDVTSNVISIGEGGCQD
ncbi:MAG: hypothetical protein R3C18_22975 [Planctomycetaceae bacterium]